MSEDNIMTREETRELFSELKTDFKESMTRIEAKIDVATKDINQYAKDTIEHAVRLNNIEKDVDSIGSKVRITQRFVWATSGGLVVIAAILKFVK